jgi:polyisoprenoid-binding protein YceI
MKQMVILAAVVASLSCASPASSADTFKVDPVHSFILFQAHHGKIGFVCGRFNDPAGTFALDESDPTKCTFAIEVPAANVDTHNAKRDEDLQGPSYLEAKKAPAIAFKSTSVKKGKDNTLEVTGTMDLHGVSKEMTVTIELVGKGEMPAGVTRQGIEAAFVIKLSDFGIKSPPGVADEVKLTVALEGIKQ